MTLTSKTRCTKAAKCESHPRLRVYHFSGKPLVVWFLVADHLYLRVRGRSGIHRSPWMHVAPMKGEMVALRAPTPSAMKTIAAIRPGKPAPWSKATGIDVVSMTRLPHNDKLRFTSATRTSTNASHKVAYHKPSNSVLYRPSRISERKANNSGLRNWKTTKTNG